MFELAQFDRAQGKTSELADLYERACWIDRGSAGQRRAGERDEVTRSVAARRSVSTARPGEQLAKADRRADDAEQRDNPISNTARRSAPRRPFFRLLGDA
jgi:hypothetical protein